jgi:deoxyribonuclease-1
MGDGPSTVGIGLRKKAGLNVEHVYPASWMGNYLGCGNREQCQGTSERFNHMEADLHNLYPALAEVNRARSNYLFGMIGGENHAPIALCDFEFDREIKIAEPRPIARGNLARSIFYMHVEYVVPILKQWNREDPSSCHEMRRNNTIEELQGTRNKFIDHPKLIEDLQF